MIKKVMDVKLNVKPVFVMFAHKYYYEGPCRMAGGDALQPGFDTMVNGAIFNGTMEGVNHMMPKCINVLEPVYLETTCDWDIKDEYFEKIFADKENVDVYLASGAFGADQVFNEFAQRCKKPIAIVPDIWGPARAGGLYNLGVDLICEITWEDLIKKLLVMRAKKAIAQANLLLVTRFNYDLPVAGATDSFINLRAVTDLMGIHFRTVNAHEIIDQLHPMPEGGNHTTPGRATPNITEEEIAELDAMADELLGGTEIKEIEKDIPTKPLIA